MVVHACLWLGFWFPSILLSDSTAGSIMYLRAWEDTMGLSHDILSADIMFSATHPVPWSQISWLPNVQGISADTVCLILTAGAHLFTAFVLWSSLQASGRRRMWHRAVFMRLGCVDSLVNVLSHNSRASSLATSARDPAAGTGDGTANIISAGITRSAAVALAHITSASDVVKDGAVGMGAIDQLVEFVAAATIAGAGIGGPGAFEDGQARESVSQSLSELLVRCCIDHCFSSKNNIVRKKILITTAKLSNA
jgi:hypothetical protein